MSIELELLRPGSAGGSQLCAIRNEQAQADLSGYWASRPLLAEKGAEASWR